MGGLSACAEPAHLTRLRRTRAPDPLAPNPLAPNQLAPDFLTMSERFAGKVHHV